MREVIDMFIKYAGGHAYMWVFFACLVFMFIVFKKDREYWSYPNLVILLVIFNPIIMYFLTSRFLVGGALGVFWRTWWIIPIPIIMAITFTKLLDYVKGKQKALVAVVLCGVIILSGQFIFNRDNFHRTQNIYQLPNEILYISELVERDLGGGNPSENKVVAVYEVAWRLRLYNPEIKMLFGRRANNSITREISSNINGRVPDFKSLDLVLQDLDVSYLVIDNIRIEALGYHDSRPEDVGYILIGDTGSYSIFRVNLE